MYIYVYIQIHTQIYVYIYIYKYTQAVPHTVQQGLRHGPIYITS